MTIGAICHQKDQLFLPEKFERQQILPLLRRNDPKLSMKKERAGKIRCGGDQLMAGKMGSDLDRFL